ncbi:MAG: M23 family metallopeptidase [Acidobacteria bacterium]|nr:M23 family metallopeptidase [Acidobacteriota bacterium]
MSTPIENRRRAVRQSRPDSLRWLTVMVILSHRSFSWSVSKQRLLLILGGTFGIWAFGVLGSSYGMWSFRKVLTFTQLQQETREQQEKLRTTLEQAQGLEAEIQTLQENHAELLKLLDPKAPGPNLTPVPQQAPSPEVKERVGQLQQQLDQRQMQARLIRARMEPILRAWAATPSIPPTAGYLSSGYGVRVAPLANVKEEGESLLGFHTGLDISNQAGTPIQATADGEVVQAGWMDRYGWGVVIKHGVELATLYAHLERVDVKPGQQVQRGDILGGMGRSGNATGVHLHYEVRRGGSPINPSPYLKLQRQWLGALSKHS